MKNIIKYNKIFIFLGAILALSACKKDKFLNVNNNPNYPATVPVNLVLPTTEANVGYFMGNTLGIYGGLWAQYWAQDPTYGSQYGNYDAYVNVPSDNDNVWTDLYTTATNFNYIISTYDTAAQKNYAAIAYIMKAYEFQVITDAWGNVPLSQALQGATGVVDPAYDNAQQVYDSIAVWVYDGLNIINASGSSSSSPPEDLIYPNQPMSQWQKFANTLLLKIYLRESGVPSINNAHNFQTLQQAMAAESGAPGFMSVPGSPTGDDAELHYIAQTYKQFPLYATGLFLEARNITGSATAINYLLALNDPRLPDFYDLNALGYYGGEVQGAWRNLSGSSDQGFSPPSQEEIIAPTASQRFITASESDFLQAEAIARGYMPGNASGMYYAGIVASFQSWPHSSQATAGQIVAYEAQDSVAYNPSNAIKLIMTQKWLSMCGNQNFEAWTEWRRTGYPNVFTYSLSSLITPGTWPLRLVYPSVELNENTKAPSLVSICQPIWWGDTHINTASCQ